MLKKVLIKFISFLVLKSGCFGEFYISRVYQTIIFFTFFFFQMQKQNEISFVASVLFIFNGFLLGTCCHVFVDCFWSYLHTCQYDQRICKTRLTNTQISTRLFYIQNTPLTPVHPKLIFHRTVEYISNNRWYSRIEL